MHHPPARARWWVRPMRLCPSIRTVDLEDPRDRSIDMTSVDVTTPTTTDVLRAVHDLAPTIAARAPEIEAARRVPTDLLGQLKDAGCFRLLRPRELGGLGANLLGALDVLEALARIDA